MPTVQPTASRNSKIAEKVIAEEATAQLNAYLAEQDQTRAETLLTDLVVSRVEPLALSVASYRLRRHSGPHHNNIEDVASEAVVAFLLHMEGLRQGRAAAVENLDAFVAMLAARACNDYFRRAHPAFHSLRNKLRYLFERYPDLVRWRDPDSGIWLCGLAAWQTDAKPGRPAIADVERIAELDSAASSLHPADQLANIFQKVGAPIPFNDLALLMARLWNVKDGNPDGEEEKDIADTGRPVDVTMAQKQWLAVLWKQIGELTRNQRAALLLNLRGPDGDCGTSLLVSTGIATIRQIAMAVGIPDLEFAQIWGRLPLSDLEIASMLALTRQRVINLRMYARTKLKKQFQQ
jgi:DNA-directed RNA polymerase specialized sigma24 family protein